MRDGVLDRTEAPASKQILYSTGSNNCLTGGQQCSCLACGLHKTSFLETSRLSCAPSVEEYASLFQLVPHSSLQVLCFTQCACACHAVLNSSSTKTSQPPGEFLHDLRLPSWVDAGNRSPVLPGNMSMPSPTYSGLKP